MSDKDTGGPAFPHEYTEGGPDPARWYYPGLSLRDYFAAKALSVWVQAHIDGRVDDLSKAAIARASYRYADAMLAERAK